LVQSSTPSWWMTVDRSGFTARAEQEVTRMQASPKGSYIPYMGEAMEIRSHRSQGEAA